MKELVKKIIKVMKAVEYLKKDGKVQYGSTKYNYLSEEKITASVRDAMIEQGLIMYPKHTEIKEDSPKFEKIVVTYCITDGENAIEIQTAGKGQDVGDKSIYKAMTGAFKYAQRQTFMISTGDDPDKDSSEKLAKDVATQEAKEKSRAMTDITEHTKTILGMNGEIFKEIFGVSNMTNLSLEDLLRLEEKVMNRKPYINGNGEHDFKIEKFEKDNIKMNGETNKDFLIRQIKWLVDETGEEVKDDLGKATLNDLDSIRNGLYDIYMKK